MFATWSVRTYYILLRYGIDVKTAEDAIRTGDLAMENKLRNAGLKFAVEMYRAAGLGVYPIFKRMHGRLDLERIRLLCGVLDRYTFHADLRDLT